MADRGTDRNGARNVGGDRAPGTGNTAEPAAAPTDVGRTSGGGNLGHEQPAEVERETNVRNNPGHRDDTARPNSGT
jgi:hypothetical protein